jgi:3,4-dihydroxy 2-butanone 4-phosphate synthase/GTP cyclohydrolase II
VAELAAGRPVLVLDTADRENEGDLVIAAEAITSESMSFLVRHSSGYICVAMPAEWADRLGLPLMCSANHERRQTAFGVAVDAAEGISTGISAHDRAITARVLADPASTPQDLRRPGHLVPLRAVAEGVLSRAGHTEAAVDLARLAGLSPVAVLAALISKVNPVHIAGQEELRAFALDQDLAVVDIAEIREHRLKTERQVRGAAAARLPLPAGEFTAVGFRSSDSDAEHLALLSTGLPSSSLTLASSPLVYVHVECIVGDVFGARSCDCAARLAAALSAIGSSGNGVVLYLRSNDRGLTELTRRLLEHSERGKFGLEPSWHRRPLTSTQLGLAANLLLELGIEDPRPWDTSDSNDARWAAHGIDWS